MFPNISQLASNFGLVKSCLNPFVVKGAKMRRRNFSLSGQRRQNATSGRFENPASFCPVSHTGGGFMLLLWTIDFIQDDTEWHSKTVYFQIGCHGNHLLLK